MDEFAVDFKNFLSVEAILRRRYANCDKTACPNHRYLLKIGSRKIYDAFLHRIGLVIKLDNAGDETHKIADFL